MLRSAGSSNFLLLAIEFSNSSMYASSENWYMGSMRDKSLITKYKTVPLIEIGIYELLEIFIFY